MDEDDDYGLDGDGNGVISGGAAAGGIDSSGGLNNDEVGSRQVQPINVVIEQQNHHVGSIYCVDWSRTERLIATGSNDRLIKLLVCPDLEQLRHNEILEMTLSGHQAIVRTVCFNPTNDLVLLSGGQSDHEVKVWNSETGINVANL